MAAEGVGQYRAGETALIIKVPEAEPVVGGWRVRFDASVGAGVRAHVSVLYPFLSQDRIGLAPEPDDQLRALTLAVADQWPEAPPYAGQFAEVIPHLTVAHGQEPSVLDTIEADLSCRLPVTARVSSVQLLVFDGVLWVNMRISPCVHEGSMPVRQP